jgi:hypothetical protein
LKYTWNTDGICIAHGITTKIIKMKKVTLVFLLVTGMQTLSFSQNSADSTSHMVQTTTREAEDHSNWGLLGLAGLIGLAGLAKKNVVERKVTYSDPQNRSRP